MENCNLNDSSLADYQRENQEVGEFIIKKYFLDQLKVDAPNPYKKNIELIISPRCNLGCKYCYVHRYRDQIFDECVFDEEKTITNLKKFLAWIEKQRLCTGFEIFSGELLAQNVGYQVLDTILEWATNVDPVLRPPSILIPTNFTFLCSEEMTKKVENYIHKFADLGIDFCLSASFDGKYMETNRPYLHDLDIPLNGKGNRDDAYYERCFAFCSKYHFGFHPMVYSKNIDKWCQNFDWFEEMLAKYDIHWECLYLLQVRNEEWTQQDVYELQNFIRHLYEFIWEKVNHQPEGLVSFLTKGSAFNMLSEPFTSTGRGLTCGIQSQFTIRLSDMMLYPCHRTGYKDFYFAQFVDDPDEIFKLKVFNPELMQATYGIHKESFPYCVTCPINKLCVGTCLGAQYETTRNLFVPIPSVCILAHAVVATSIECLLKYDAFGLMLSHCDPDKCDQLMYVKKEIFGK